MNDFHVLDYPIAISQAAAVLVNLVIFRLTHVGLSEVEMFAIAVVVQGAFALAAQLYTRSKNSLRRENNAAIDRTLKKAR